jgi:hypothetical protein
MRKTVIRDFAEAFGCLTGRYLRSMPGESVCQPEFVSAFETEKAHNKTDAAQIQKMCCNRAGNENRVGTVNF